MAYKYESVNITHTIDGDSRTMGFLGVALVLINFGLLESVFESVQDTQESDFDNTVITCKDSDLSLRCGVGVIFIKSARFGYRRTRICGPARPHIEMDPARCLPDIPSIPKWCNGRTECVIKGERIARPNHCFYTHYTTTYICVPAKTTVICEFESDSLECEHGRIKILAANYGRTDGTTCLRRRPYRWHQNKDCYSHNSLDLVSERCEGKKYCSLSASNAVFSDPCFGTRKYLQVTYSCPAYED